MANCNLKNPEETAETLENLGHYLIYAALNFTYLDKCDGSEYDEHFGWYRLLLAAEKGEL